MRPRIATPLDHYVGIASLWFQSMWPVWAGLAVCIVMIIVIASISKSRAKARARVPRYRRQETGPIPLLRSRP